MRLFNIAGRLTVLSDGRPVDVEQASSGRFAADPQQVYDRWDEFREWASALAGNDVPPRELAGLQAPVPAPRQVFAIGLNYVDHAGESGFAVPSEPVVFTKFVSSFTGPSGAIVLPPGDVDWEVELAVVMGRQARSVAEDRAWSYVAGLTVAQDLSERASQLRGPAPQFSLAKSFPGFTPLGPAVVTVDEVADPDDLAIECRLDGEVVQRARTTDMIFPVPELIARLSRVVTLFPGDLVLTGTPPGVGMGRTPARYLQAGQVLESRIEGIGEMRHHMVLPEPGPAAAHTADGAVAVG